MLKSVEHRLLRAEVRLHGEVVEAVVVKARRPDALRLVRRLEGVTAISAQRTDSTLAFRLWRGPLAGDLLSRLEVAEGEEGQRWASACEVLVVAAGGPRRRSLNWSDVLWIRRLAAPVMTVDPSSLPEASDTLLRFVAPLKPAQMPPHVASELMEMASKLWSGVVLADFAGRPEQLVDAREEVRGRGAPAGLVDLLVERKRKTFAADPRLLSVSSVQHTEAGLEVVVQADLPAAIRSK